MERNRRNGALTERSAGDPIGRRRLMALGVAAVGAATALFSSRQPAEAHGTVHYESATADPAVHGNNSNDGPGVMGTASTLDGFGVLGQNFGDGEGVLGRSLNGSGVRGRTASALSPAVVGVNTGGGAGVVGRATGTAGVRGTAPGDAPGVLAESGTNPPGGPRTLDTGLALLATGKSLLRPPTEADGLPPGVLFTGPTLRVEGAAQLAGQLYTGVGSGTIPAGTRAQLVTDANATATSHVSVVLVGPPSKPFGKGAAVSWVERASGSFTVHLTDDADFATPFTYTLVQAL
jgi:hypothetical protein